VSKAKARSFDDKVMAEVLGVYECVAPVIEEALERLRRARAKLLDMIARDHADGLGEVLGDVNKAISDLEGVLKLLRGRRPWLGS
jgi:hypothetical protein